MVHLCSLPPNKQTNLLYVLFISFLDPLAKIETKLLESRYKLVSLLFRQVSTMHCMIIVICGLEWCKHFSCLHHRPLYHYIVSVFIWIQINLYPYNKQAKSTLTQLSVSPVVSQTEILLYI